MSRRVTGPVAVLQDVLAGLLLQGTDAADDVVPGEKRWCWSS